MVSVNKRIKNKLLIYNIKSFDDLDEKTLKRLQEVEETFMKLEDKSEKIFQELRSMNPNITMIIKSENISFSRKTVYNDETLKDYIENSIRDFPDYLNEKKIEKVQEEQRLLREFQDKIADNIIDYYDKEEKLDMLNEEINNLIKENDTLRKIISERDKEIKRLNKSKKVISLNKNL